MAHPYWPLFDIEVRTPQLTLVAVTDERCVELAALAARGIHDPSFTPFSIPWTDQQPPELERGVLQFHWRSRAEISVNTWRVAFAVIHESRVVGSTDLVANDFPVMRQFETGSWLGRRHQGQGLGKEMRIAALTFGFVGLDGEFATTGAWHDNGPSLGVTRSLGYEPEGARRSLRREEPDTILEFRMSREHFMTHLRRDDIDVIGDEGARNLLGISR